MRSCHTERVSDDLVQEPCALPGADPGRDCRKRQRKAVRAGRRVDHLDGGTPLIATLCLTQPEQSTH